MARILLTGATSGIGLAAATQLASEPHELMIHGPEPESRVDAAIEQIRRAAASDTRVIYAQADFSDPNGPRLLANQATSDLPHSTCSSTTQPFPAHPS
jgi:NAD(P)-dependent dehydrogenase (short-subunit alcohol dehydrogenase family)